MGNIICYLWKGGNTETNQWKRMLSPVDAGAYDAGQRKALRKDRGWGTTLKHLVAKIVK
jgi:hypothetical protein